MADRPQPLLPQPEPLQRPQLMHVRIGDVGEVGPEQDPVAETERRESRGSARRGNGANPSLKSVNAIVVSSRTSPNRSARSRKSSYSGMPMCANTSRSRGWRASTRPTGSGPVCLPGEGPEPQWITTGIPASASNPQAGSSSSSAGSYAPTWTWALKTRAPSSSALRTYASTPGSGNSVAVWRQSGVRRAKSTAHRFSHSAMPGLCG